MTEQDKPQSKKKRRGNGEGSIYQRADGRWVGCISAEQGKRKYFYGQTRKEVAERLKVALREQQQGLLTTGPDQTLGTYLERWLEDVHRASIKVSSYYTYRKHLKNYLLPGLGQIRLQRLHPQQVQAFYAAMSQHLTPKTVHMIHELLHKALKDALRWGLVGRNVCDLVSPPRVQQKEMQVLSPEQIHTFVAAIHGHPFEALFLLAVTTGMRQGELLALRWSDVELDQRSLQIQRTVGWVAGQYLESEPKTRGSRRKIMLPEVVVARLKEHRSRQPEAGKHALAFSDQRGNFLSPNRVVRQFRQVLRQAGLPLLRFHDLRHSAATLLLSLGVPLKVVQETLGHASISITGDRYAHVVSSMQQEATERVNGFFDHDED